MIVRTRGDRARVGISDGGQHLEDVIAGTNITIDKTDPRNPVISSTGGRGTVSAASTSSLTIDSDTTYQYSLTALAAGLSIEAPTGTPYNGQDLLIRILDNGTARALTWNAIFRVIGVTLPTTTVISKTMYIACIYNSTDTKWDVIGVREQA